jgi:hypothetical protein
MDATTPSTTDDEFDLDVRFTDSDLDVAGGGSEDCDDTKGTKECTDDECEDTRGCT